MVSASTLVLVGLEFNSRLVSASLCKMVLLPSCLAHSVKSYGGEVSHVCLDMRCTTSWCPIVLICHAIKTSSRRTKWMQLKHRQLIHHSKQISAKVSLCMWSVQHSHVRMCLTSSRTCIHASLHPQWLHHCQMTEWATLTKKNERCVVLISY